MDIRKRFVAISTVLAATFLLACVMSLTNCYGEFGSALLSSSDCKLCERSTGREVARICSNCSSKAGSNCVLCNRSTGREVMRICSNCSSKCGSNCVLCNRSTGREVAKICSSCANK